MKTWKNGDGIDENYDVGCSSADDRAEWKYRGVYLHEGEDDNEET